MSVYDDERAAEAEAERWHDAMGQDFLDELVGPDATLGPFDHVTVPPAFAPSPDECPF